MKKSGIDIKSKSKRSTRTKLYMGFIMGSIPVMSSRATMESVLTTILEGVVVDKTEIFLQSKKAKQFNQQQRKCLMQMHGTSTEAKQRPK